MQAAEAFENRGQSAGGCLRPERASSPGVMSGIAAAGPAEGGGHSTLRSKIADMALR